MKQVKGRFEVKSTPLEMDSLTKALGAVRMMFEKEFAGPLKATGVVSMMGIMNMETASGAYVALEKITGELDGKKGSFCMQHSSSMSKGKPSQAVSVVPDSGTGELTGLNGTMLIDIVGEEHFYTLDYELK